MMPSLENVKMTKFIVVELQLIARKIHFTMGYHVVPWPISRLKFNE